MGAKHPMLCHRDVKLMNVCTIMLIGMMTMALKVLARFTLGMGTLTFESDITLILPVLLLRKHLLEDNKIIINIDYTVVIHSCHLSAPNLPHR